MVLDLTELSHVGQELELIEHLLWERHRSRALLALINDLISNEQEKMRLREIK